MPDAFINIWKEIRSACERADRHFQAAIIDAKNELALAEEYAEETYKELHEECLRQKWCQKHKQFDENKLKMKDVEEKHDCALVLLDKAVENFRKRRLKAKEESDRIVQVVWSRLPANIKDRVLGYQSLIDTKRIVEKLKAKPI